MSTPPANFRVIIVGGGPIGLTAAHMLSKAGIDFILLERRGTVTPQDGTSLAIAPQTLRVLDQLDLLEPVRWIDHAIRKKNIVTHKGVLYNTTYPPIWAEEDHGRPYFMVHRPEFLETLYNHLSDADKGWIFTHKNVVDIESNPDGVIVKCDDGTEVDGHIVIGADGVHSRVRKEMRNLALLKNPRATVNDEQPLEASYRCLYATTDLMPGMVPGESWGAHGSGASTQVFVGRDRTWFFVYEQLDWPTRDWKKYSAKEEEEFVAKYGKLAMTERYRLKDLYAVKRNSTLVNLEEGTMKVFSFERLAIVGDAVNKQTPNVGNGYNSGVQDLVVLTTGLRKLLDSREVGEIATENVQEVLQEYQALRERDAKDICGKSGQATRMQAWNTWGLWLFERYIMPWGNMDRRVFSKMAGDIIRKGRVLPFLEEKDLRHGKVPWVHFPTVGPTKVETSSVS
ncbi:uncharacterized protein BCR38DRAFT_436448 [Pseudomassariella vexata]|uniref:FAD-binding domain-containing protein n=1 Tax=Pseudomassariella vexata TaxID=1141098 RepID=A0A1Y2DVL3_9PEZI|nr:uncharacterized protein BCR38DRAFT_436448 [Pseudomassariella vexata]ORY63297.1 hypothetical protein BCR38DRAFT_436448 [Pseudomassariella vexata]